MSEIERIDTIAEKIKQNKLSWLFLFLIESHLPLRGIISQGIQGFDPLIRTLIGKDNSESIKWIFNSSERMNYFLEKLAVK